MAKKKFEKEVKALVEYVKENMEHEDDWVIIRYRDVPKITNASSYYVRKLFELLKEHPNIIFEIDEEAKTNKKPLQFRYVSQDEKINLELSSKQFYYLTEEEIEYAKDSLDLDEFTELYRELSVINYLASLGAKEEPVEFDKKAIIDTLLTTKAEFEQIFDNLVNSRLILDLGTHVRLVLSAEASKGIEVSSYTPKVNDTSLDTGKLVEKVLNTQGLQVSSDPVEDEMSESNTLTDNLRYFRNAIESVQDEFKSFLDDRIREVTDAEKKAEEMDKGYQTLEKLVKENEQLKSKNEALQSENQRLAHSLQVSEGARDKFFANAEQRLEILLAEVIGITTNYAQIPGWKKDQAANAKLQKNILDAVTAAVNDMLNSNHNA